VNKSTHCHRRRTLTALAEAFEVLSLVPERGEPINADNPTGGVYQRPFGPSAAGWD